MIKLFCNLYQQHTILRFLVIGGVNTVFGYSIFSLFILLGLHYRLAVLLAIVAGVLFNFITYGNCVFYNNAPKLIFKFIVVYAVIYWLNITGLAFLLKHHINTYFAQAILILPLAICTYFLNKKFVFHVANSPPL